MRKTLGKILTIIVSMVLIFSCFVGCNLVTVNEERDMQQVIAEVQIDDSIEKDVIYKRELVSAYNSYGYYYVSYYNYTVADTYELIIKNLVQSKVIVQHSKLALSSGVSDYGTTYSNGFYAAASSINTNDRTDIEQVLADSYKEGLKGNSPNVDFLTDYEISLSKYNAYSSILSMVTSLLDEEEEEDDEYETFTISSPRATLTAEEEEDGNEYELKSITPSTTYLRKMKKVLEDIDVSSSDIDALLIGKDSKYDVNLAVYKKYVEELEKSDGYILGDNDRKGALKKAIRKLANNGLVTTEEKNISISVFSDIFQIGLFSEQLESQYENRIVSKFELALENKARKEVDLNPDSIYNEFVELYNYQKEQYDSDITSYESALSDATGKTFVLYNPVVVNRDGDHLKYGYVLNLLVGFSSDTTTKLSDYKAEGKKTNDEINEYRDSLVNEITVQDLRSDWVYSNYGTYDAETGKFTFKDENCKTDALKVFDGIIKNEDVTEYTYTDSDGIEQTGFLFDNITPNTLTYAEFKTLLDSMVNLGISTNNSGSISVSENSDYLGNSIIDEETLTTLRDIVYAYSTDSGSLAENYGYLSSPITSSYVTEFKEAARRIVDLGVGAWEACVTDYGVHIMICTKVIDNAGVSIEDLYASADAFRSEITTEGTLAYDFAQYKLDLYIDNDVSKVANAFINNNMKKVTYFEDRYSDLLD